MCHTPTLTGETGGWWPKPGPSPRTTSSRRLKRLGLPHACLSHHQCRSSFLFAGLGAHCYGDSRRCPLQVADTRPGPSLGLPLSLQLFLQQLGWQNHLVAIKGAVGRHCPGTWVRHLLSLPGPGTFQTQDTRSPVRQEGQARGRGNRHFLGVAEGT